MEPTLAQHMQGKHLEFRGVHKSFGDQVVIEDFSLEIRNGEIFVLLGPSGCGKSTALQLVNRLLKPDSGSIYLNGSDISTGDPVALRRQIGYVIQQIGLFPHRTVAENIATVCNLNGWAKSTTSARVNEMLNLVNLDPLVYSQRYPHELSGGQQQRVGVARALASAPHTLLMDEPFGALDPVVRRQVQSEFREWVRALGTTVVFVTHDVDEAVLLADRMVILSGACHIEQIGTPLDVLSRPETEAVSEFLGTDRVLRALSVIPVTQVLASSSTLPMENNFSWLNASATAHDALTMMLRDGSNCVRISHINGDHAGVVTWDSLVQAARSSTIANHAVH